MPRIAIRKISEIAPPIHHQPTPTNINQQKRNMRVLETVEEKEGEKDHKVKQNKIEGESQTEDIAEVDPLELPNITENEEIREDTDWPEVIWKETDPVATGTGHVGEEEGEYPNKPKLQIISVKKIMQSNTTEVAALLSRRFKDENDASLKFVISGFSDTKTSEIKKKIKSAGGKIRKVPTTTTVNILAFKAVAPDTRVRWRTSKFVDNCLKDSILFAKGCSVPETCFIPEGVIKKWARDEQKNEKPVEIISLDDSSKDEIIPATPDKTSYSPCNVTKRKHTDTTHDKSGEGVVPKRIKTLQRRDSNVSTHIIIFDGIESDEKENSPEKNPKIQKLMKKNHKSPNSPGTLPSPQVCLEDENETGSEDDDHDETIVKEINEMDTHGEKEKTTAKSKTVNNSGKKQKTSNYFYTDEDKAIFLGILMNYTCGDDRMSLERAYKRIAKEEQNKRTFMKENGTLKQLFYRMKGEMSAFIKARDSDEKDFLGFSRQKLTTWFRKMQLK